MSAQFIYFAGALGKIKIGCSNKPAERILQVGEWIPFPITLLATMPGGYPLESALHAMFADEWSHGEWFHASARLLELVDRVAQGLPVAISKPDLGLSENRRRQMIAAKKRISRKVRALSEEYRREFRTFAPGMPLSQDFVERVDAAHPGPTKNWTAPSDRPTPNQGEAA